jgi:hypothetical protein
MILADQDGRVRGIHAGVARRPEFCPLEDVLRVGSLGGLSTLLVPGAGTANFDRFHYRPTILPPAIASPAPAPSLIPRLLPHSQLQRVRPAVRTLCLLVCLFVCVCLCVCFVFVCLPASRRTRSRRRSSGARKRWSLCWTRSARGCLAVPRGDSGGLTAACRALDAMRAVTLRRSLYCLVARSGRR